jgi:hypothetical protein
MNLSHDDPRFSDPDYQPEHGCAPLPTPDDEPEDGFEPRKLEFELEPVLVLTPLDVVLLNEISEIERTWRDERGIL